MKPSFNPRLQWSDPGTGQLTSEAQRILRALLDIAWKRTGLETSSVVTGTAGANGNISKWNADGDLVDGGKAAADLLTISNIEDAINNGTTDKAPSENAVFDALALKQALDSDLTSWAAVTRASGFDTFAATASSANLRALLSDESGTGAALFAGGNIGAATATSINFGQSTFNFFEQGTFTPAFSAVGGTFSHSIQSGRYLRIGPYVFYSIYMRLNTSGNTVPAATLSITGFPYTIAASSIDRYRSSAVWFASTSSYVNMVLQLNQNTTSAQVSGATAAATTNAIVQNASAVLHATNGSVLIAVGFYEV